MALAATHFDLVQAIDIHFQMVTTPAGPVPMPLPSPFVGMVFDPAGLLIGAAINEAMSALSGSITGPVYINGVPAATVGTEAINLLKHVHYAGSSWAPVPRLPPPPLKPGATPPDPPSPLSPSNDGPLIQGSETVTIQGISASRDSELLMTCGEPVRLPLGMVMAIPKGRPVNIGGPSSISLLDVAFALVRTRWAAGFMHSLANRIASRRLRSLFRGAVCFLTGHPVDVANGRVLTSNADWSLPGPLPLVFERHYNSGFARRMSPLGHGWSHTLDQAVWEEDGAVVLLADDGRELELCTIGQPDDVLPVGEKLYHPSERVWLEKRSGGRFRVTDHEGVVRDFGPVEGAPAGRAKLLAISDRHENRIALEYDGRGYLRRVTDSVGRIVRFAHDDRGRLKRVYLPDPEDPGREMLHTTYHYSDEQWSPEDWARRQKEFGDLPDDLVRVTDPRRTSLATDYSWRYAYMTHLLVEEIDRENLAFYFGYDGLGQDAYCVRTWGTNELFHRELRYDKANKLTVVVDSRGNKTQYRMNVLGQVVEVLDPHGALTRYEYDEPSLQRSAEIDALGHAIRTTYDALGRPTRVVDRDGATTVLHYDEHPHEACFSTPCREESPAGGVWRYEHDAFGNVKSETDPLGFTRTYAYARGQLASMRSAGGRETRFFRDTQCNVVRVDDASRVFTLTCDGWGRVTSITDPLGATTRYRLDEAGNILARFLPDGSEWQYVPDGECNVVRTIGPRSEAAFAFDGHYELNTVTHPDGSEVHLEHDSEDDLTAVVNENGDVYRFELDARGDVQKEVGFDGVFRRYVRDELRRVVRVYHQKKPGTDYDAKYADLTYDACGRLTRVDLFDGLAFEPVAFERYAYDAAGLLVEAENECSLVRFERDLLGRVTKEIVRHGGEERWVASTYSPDGERTSRVTSLGHREVYLRNVHGEVEELETGTAHRPVSWRFERNDLGQEVERHFPGGAREQRIYHPGSHLPKRRVLVDARGETVGETLYNWSGTRLQKEWRRGFALRHFDHDARDRLVASREALDEQRTAWRTTWRCPDPAGNLFFDPQLTSAEYGPGGVLREAGGTRYETNLRGERIAEHYADDTSRLLSWNAAGRLERVQMPDGTEVSFEYDALGRRLAKRVQTPEPERGGEGRAAETAWLWDGDVPVHERGSDAAWATWMHEPDTFAPLGRRDGKGFSSIATDYLGNPTEGLDELGQLVWAMQLDVFGVPHGLEGPGRACPWRFPGQYEDAETGLFYNRHRYYAPGEGGYLSVDPIGLWGGPHLYGYTADPLSAIDPLGLVPSPGAGEPLYVGSYSRSRYGNQRTGLAQSYTPHHVVQDAVSPVSHGRGITINIPKLVHERTLTMRRRRPQMTLWNHLLQDVHELRALLLAYGFPRNLVNQQLRQLVQQHIDRDGLTKLKTCRR